jgi:predicted O-linked N-acetylglucosamine transferase (SPINDLY family)
MFQTTIQQAYEQALRHHHAGRLAEAEQIYRQILSQQPRHAFVNIAVELARDSYRLHEIHSTLRRRMEQSSLMDSQRFARDMENAYRQMWRQWCEGGGA